MAVRPPPARVALFAFALAAVAVVAAGLVLLRGGGGAGAAGPPPPGPHEVAREYVEAWERGDFRSMYGLLTPASRQATGYRAFVTRHRDLAAAATLQGIRRAGDAQRSRTGATVPVALRTRLYGRVRTTLDVPARRLDGRWRVRWAARLAFPGLRWGERLERRAGAPAGRGAILAADGTVLAQGPVGAREYPQGAAYATVTGLVRAAPGPAAERRRRAAGWPAGRPYGQAGLEQSLDGALSGTPNMTLLARGRETARVLAVRAGREPVDVRTTLDPGAQSVAATALGGRYGGIVVLDARTGAVRASAGYGMDITQPPGSVFKAITAATALTSRAATPTTTYPYERVIEMDGWRLRNFRREWCGGTLVESFAHSCNTVFAPLAAELGGERLVRFAERFGFNRRPGIAYPAPMSVAPAPATLTSDLDVGVVGIGQGTVSASPLQMASVAQSIAAGGVLRPPFVVAAPPPLRDRRPPRRVMPRGVAASVAEMMKAVVTSGTGTGAALAGVTVAGKTGTAELGPGQKDDAWFIAYAPAERPRVAVAVLIVHGGVGGEVAAPIAGQLLAGLLAS
jgi:hypothetical protein